MANHLPPLTMMVSSNLRPRRRPRTRKQPPQPSPRLFGNISLNGYPISTRLFAPLDASNSAVAQPIPVL